MWIDHAILEIRQKHYEPFLKSDVRGIEANGRSVCSKERCAPWPTARRSNGRGR